jgi:hypothetical protein
MHVCTLGMLRPSPHKRNLILRLQAQRGYKRDYTHIIVEGKIWIIGVEEILGFPRGFFFGMLASLNLVEADCPSPHDPILLTQ